MAVERRMTWSAAAGVLVALLVAPALGCAPVTSGTAPLTSGVARLATGAAPLTRGDLRWLARGTFGIHGATVAADQRLGGEKVIDRPTPPPSPDPGGTAPALPPQAV